MAKQPNTKMIGLFMISGMVLFLGIVGLFLKNRFFTDSSNTLVMYFDESIRGLSVGSSVLFNGVEIGRVSKIQLVTNVSDLSFRVPVYVQLTEYRSSLSDKSFHSRKDLLNELIDKGLRARLGTQNYLTGQLIIELVMQPESPVNLRNIKDNGDILEIPTVLSSISKISQDFSQLPLKEGLADLFGIFKELHHELPPLLDSLNQAAGGINNLIDENSGVSLQMMNNVNKAALSIDKAADSFRDLTDYLERHPESLLRGKEKK